MAGRILDVGAAALVFVLLAWRYVEREKGRGRPSEIPYWRLATLGLAIVVLSAASLNVATWLRSILIAASLGLTALAFARDARAERNMFPRRVIALDVAFAVLPLLLVVTLLKRRRSDREASGATGSGEATKSGCVD